MRKEVQVVMLPTEKARMCKMIDLEDNSFKFLVQPNNNAFIDEKSHGFHIKPFHLYLVSNEEIKEGDWFITTNSGKNHNEKVLIEATRTTLEYVDKHDFKVIATTDKSLTVFYKGHQKYTGIEISADVYLPGIPTSFIEAYVKAEGKIDKVMVEYVVHVMALDTMEESLHLKLREDNTVKIHKIEEKTFTKDELASAIERFSWDKTQGVDIETVQEWIEENL